MTQDQRDWQRARDRKRYIKWLNASPSDDISGAYYNPREFRESAQGREAPARGRKWVAIVMVGMLFVAAPVVENYRSGGLVWKLMHADGRAEVAQWFSTAPRTPQDVAIDGTIGDWRRKATPQLSVCTGGNFADPENIVAFERDSESFLKKVAALKIDVESRRLSRSQIRAVLDVHAREASALVGFYNRNLVKCYGSHSAANDVATRADSITVAMQDLREVMGKAK